MKAIPTTYKGTEFRSRLEAHWALNLDEWGIRWQYELEGYVLPSGARYLPDFYLPEITTWLEVKGPTGDGLEKTQEFAREVMGDDWNLPNQLVVIGEAPYEGNAVFRAADQRDINLIRHCGMTSFFDFSGAWTCRACRAGGKVYAGDCWSSSPEPRSGLGGDPMPFRTIQWKGHTA